MSQEKVEIRRSTKHPSTINQRSTVINRTSAGGLNSSLGLAGSGGGRSSMSMRMSYGGGAPNFATGTVTQMSQKNVANVLDTRAKEKTEMNVLNERFASYIEKVRFVEAQNKALLAEIERLKKQKNFDCSEIKELYEQEIADSRKIIDDLSNDKANFDSSLVSLQDQLEDEKRDRSCSDKTVEDRNNKIDQLNDQIGGYEGELANLRLRIDALEDENARLKKRERTLQDDVQRIRADLDEETTKRIQAEMKLQTMEEDFKFNANIYEAEIAELRSMLNKDKTIEMKDIWKGEMSKAINELNQQYAAETDRMQAEMQKNFEMQMNDMRAGVNRDNMEAVTAREESKKVKGKLNELQPLINQLQAENAMLRSQVESLKNQMEDENREHNMEKEALERRVMELSNELEIIMKELAVLQDAKLSLELEIACYRKLLEAEERSLKNVVEEASGARSSGAQLLSDMITSKGGGGGDSQQKSSYQTSSRKVNLVKKAIGDMHFERCDASGATVTIKNHGGKNMSLGGWTIKKTGGSKLMQYTFGDSVTVNRGSEITIASKGSGEHGDFIAGDVFSWGSTGMFTLADEKDGFKASLDVKVM